MKHLLLLLALLVLPLAAQAQFFLSVYGGYNTVTRPEETADWWSNGYSLGARFSYPINDVLEFVVDSMFGDYSFQDAAFAEDFAEANPNDPVLGELGATNVTTRSVLINLKVSVPSPYVRPYVLGGVGYFAYSRPLIVFRTEVGGVRGSYVGVSEDGFGLQIGGGIDVPISPRFGLFAEGRYLVGGIEEQYVENGQEVTEEVGVHVIPIVAGVRFSLSRR